MFKGIDVSKWQGKIDWKKVKAAGIQFAMIRSSARSTYVDEMFMTNVQGCIDNGIDYGLYHVLYADTVDKAKAEAQHFLSTIKGLNPTYPVVLDLERWDENANCSGETLTAMAIAFAEIIIKAGYYFMLYANKSWLTGVLDYVQLKAYDIWLAQWSENPTWSGTFGLWQHTNCGKVDGISGNVDLNISYKDYPKIIKEMRLNGLVSNPDAIPVFAASNKQKQSSVQKPADFISYKVQPGDSFWQIAQAKLGNGNRFMEIVNFNGLTRDTVIHPGDIIKIPCGSFSPVKNTAVNKTHVVNPGESFWSISRDELGAGNRFMEIIQLNGLNKNSVIHPGQVLKIPTLK